MGNININHFIAEKDFTFYVNVDGHYVLKHKSGDFINMAFKHTLDGELTKESFNDLCITVCIDGIEYNQTVRTVFDPDLGYCIDSLFVISKKLFQNAIDHHKGGLTFDKGKKNG